MFKPLSKVAVLALLTTACKIKNAPENFGFVTKPGIVTPLVDMDVKLKDVLNSQAVVPDLEVRNDLYVITYKNTVFTGKASDYIQLQDQGFSQSYALPNTEILNYNVATQGYTFKQTTQGEIDFSVSGDQLLTRAVFKSGLIQTRSTSLYPYETQVILEFPDILSSKDNSKLSLSYRIAANTTVPIINSQDLANYDADLSKGGLAQNKLRYNLSVSVIKPSGQTAPITPANNKFEVGIDIKNMQYSYLEGYLGEINLGNIADSVRVEMFKNSIYGNIEFKEPLVRISVDNSAGIPASVNVKPLKVKFANRNIVDSVTRNGSTTFLDTVIQGAAITAPRTPVTTNIVWNANNSDVQKVFKPSPFTVKYNASVVLNKKSSIPKDLKNFITDESMIQVRAYVELPMIGVLNTLTVLDTVDITLNNDFQKSYNIDSIKYKLNTENGFPIDCKLQVYFLDSNKVIKDSLIDKKDLVILSAGKVDADGRVIERTKRYYARTFPKSQYDATIKDAKYLIVKGRFNSYLKDGVPQVIKIFSDNSLRVKLTLEAGLNINFSTKDN